MSQNKIYIILITIIISITSIQASEKIYKWTDSKGNIHFSDIPPDNDKGIHQSKIKTIKINNKTNTIDSIKDDKVKKTSDDAIESEIESKIKEFKKNPKSMLKKANSKSKSDSDSESDGKKDEFEEEMNKYKDLNKMIIKILDKVSQNKNTNNKNCQVAHNNLKKLSHNKDIIILNKNKINKLSNSKIKSAIKKSQKEINQFC